MDLADLLSEHRDRVIQRWVEKVRDALHTEAMPKLALEGYLPSLLGEVARSIRRSSLPDVIETAAEHGGQRLHLGSDLGSVVREYGALHDAVVEEAAAEGIAIDPVDERVLFHCVITGIADAVSEYQRQRDAELN